MSGPGLTRTGGVHGSLTYQNRGGRAAALVILTPAPVPAGEGTAQ